MNWDLQVCSWRGHETYAPDEPQLRERLRAVTVAGETWRCLRCGTFVPGSPRRSGPADTAPEIPRGRLLRDRIILRALAVDRGIRALVCLLLVFVVLRFAAYRDGFEEAFERDFPLLQPFLRQIGWNLADSALLRLINDAFSMSPAALNLLALAVAGYAALLCVEAIGLLLQNEGCITEHISKV